MFTNAKPAPPTIAGTIFVITNDRKTNGENVKNSSTFAKRSWVKLSMNNFKLNPSRPAIKPKTSVDKLVTTVKIKIQTKNMTYLLNKKFPRDTGIVSIVLRVCSLYSLPNRYEIIIAKSRTANNADIYIFTLLNNNSKVLPSSNAKTAINIKNGGKIAPIKLNRNMFDLLSFKNSISMKVNILSPQLLETNLVKNSSKFSSHKFTFLTSIPALTNNALNLSLMLRWE